MKCEMYLVNGILPQRSIPIFLPKICDFFLFFRYNSIEGLPQVLQNEGKNSNDKSLVSI